jgi:putative endonuclease
MEEYVMAHNQRLGKIGENIAVSYLREKGYRIIERNWRYLHKEIDIIAGKGDELVIVEVKTRQGETGLLPGDLVPHAKQRYLINATDAYIRWHGVEQETRFDVIIVNFPGQGEYEVEHIERAFYPTL